MLKRVGCSGILLIVSALTSSGQMAPSRPTFEVAVIKPVDLAQLYSSPAAVATQGVRISSQQVTVVLPLRDIIAWAYGTRAYRLEGPDWLVHPRGPVESLFYAIDAKLPAGAKPAQVSLMMQALLEDRFKLKVRKSSKLEDVYALLVGKDGPKFQSKESSEDGFAKLEMTVSPGGGQFNMGGARIVSEERDGRMRIEASRPGELTELLSTFMPRPIGLDFPPIPVVDKSGMNGNYDIKLDLPAAPRLVLAGAGDATEAGKRLREEASDTYVEGNKRRVLGALEKIGLKLELQKGQIETIVIEHMEKDPTEN